MPPGGGSLWLWSSEMMKVGRVKNMRRGHLPPGTAPGPPTGKNCRKIGAEPSDFALVRDAVDRADSAQSHADSAQSRADSAQSDASGIGRASSARALTLGEWMAAAPEDEPCPCCIYGTVIPKDMLAYSQCRTCVCARAGARAHVYAQMHVRMYVCMHARMCACLHA